MHNFIQTQRLEIKPFSISDTEALEELMMNDEIKKTFILPDFSTQEALNQMVHWFFSISQREDRFVRGIYFRNRLVGFVNDVEIRETVIELGYVIHPHFWGKGFATEMLDAIIHQLLNQGYDTIKTGAFCENTASIRVMEKCGMQRCPETETIAYRGKTHTCIYYEKIRDPDNLAKGQTMENILR